MSVPSPNRRDVLQLLAALGVGSTTFQRAVAVQTEENERVTAEMIKQAEWVAGLSLTDSQRREIVSSVNRTIDKFRAAREVDVPDDTFPALTFDPAPWSPPDPNVNIRRSVPLVGEGKRPESDAELAFLSLTELARLIRDRSISSVELTKLYLARLKKYDPALYCVVNLTEEIALKQAAAADAEIAKGKYRGPLHGIPWGAKDLITYPGAPTTWGAPQYQKRTLNGKATVARLLDEAGAVLVAKLSLGALAQGDRWYRGMTRNPWNAKQGSSGSSAGSASATAAGLVGFAIGSETLGSIVSPCTRCGVTGLRPTFGRVSRAGCMALAWSMDKLGPIARSVEDCAAIFAAIHGADGIDPSAVTRPFDWPLRRELADIRVGYTRDQRDLDDREDLRVLRELGVRLVPIELPGDLPTNALTTILEAEAATAFDTFTREGITEGLNSWPITFRRGQFIPAVEYIRANRIRAMLMARMREVMTKVDCYVSGHDLVITNLTGHPTVVMPNGFRRLGGIEIPEPITFTGRLHDESTLLTVAMAYQNMTGQHKRRPPMEKLLPLEQPPETNP